MPTALVYLRISEDREGTKFGVTNQRSQCEDLAKVRRLKVLETFEDNSISAYSGAERPAYKRLVDAVAEGGVDYVIASAQDRLWRSPGEQELFLVLAKATNTKVLTPSQEIDPADADDEFTATLLAALARRESATIGKRMKAAQTARLKQGK
ncbi:MAG TPA: recombinase family protein, partial [Acidimicrobiia bacterium]